MHQRFDNGLTCYAGAKNLLNWTPWDHLPPGVSYMGNTQDPFEQNTPPGELVLDPHTCTGRTKAFAVSLG